MNRTAVRCRARRDAAQSGPVRAGERVPARTGRSRARFAAWSLALVLPALVVAGCTPVGADPGELELPDEPDAVEDAELAGHEHAPDVVPGSPHPEDIDLSDLPQIACAPTDPLQDVVDVDPSEDPSTGMLMAKLAGDRWVGLPLRHTSFDTIVTGTVAETVVTQRFVNPLSEPIEAIYTFPLPHDGAVDDYWLRIADRHIRGVILEREDARETYEEAKKNGQSAALLEQERPNIFTQSVANIPPGASIDVGMHVVQPLSPTKGRYTLALPTVVGPRYIPGASTGTQSGTGMVADTDVVPDASKITPPVLPEGFRTCGDLEITVSIDAGVPVRGLRSRSHRVELVPEPGGAEVSLDERYAVLNKDFQLTWSLSGAEPTARLMADPDDDGKGGWFTLTVHPPAQIADEDAARREMVFVVDNSGSMGGTPIETAKATMRRFLEGLRADEGFQVLRFSESASGLGTTIMERTDDNVDAGLDYVDAMAGMGGTRMTEGIRAALTLPRDRSRSRYVVFLTDGYIGNEREIFQLVDKELGDTRIFSLGIGSAPNRYLLDGLARMGGGAAHYVDEGRGAEVVDALYEQLRAPALTNLSVEFSGIKVPALAPARLPDLFVGQPVVVFGRYEGKLGGKAIVRGTGPGGTVTIPVEIRQADAERVGGLESMWARTRIDDLLFDPVQMGDYGQPSDATRERVIDLSLKHRVLTEFTAFVAVDAATVVQGAGTDITVVQGVDSVHGMAQGMIHQFEYGGPERPGTGLGSGGGQGAGTIGAGSGYGRGSGAGFGGRGRRVPRVRMAKAQVKGSIDRHIIRRIVRNHINEVRHCYNEALTRDPTAAGRVTMQFVISPTGAVSNAVVGDSDIEDAELGRCIAKAVKRWTFPVSADAGNALVNYPFVFKPAEDSPASPKTPEKPALPKPATHPKTMVTGRARP